MADHDIGLEILEGIREIKAYKAGGIELKATELKDSIGRAVLFRPGFAIVIVYVEVSFPFDPGNIGRF